MKTQPLPMAPALCCPPLAAPRMDDAEAQTAAAVFKALADPARVRIVNLLAISEEPVCVCDITGIVGLSQPTTSFHLKKLMDAGLLTREQRGTWAYYGLNRTALRKVGGVFTTRRTTT